jgi:hypothetical protein
MPAPEPRRKWEPKFKQVAKQPATQTAKANSTPRLGQGTRSKSAYHKYFQGQKSKHTLDTPSYNVGRTRRMA